MQESQVCVPILHRNSKFKPASVSTNDGSKRLAEKAGRAVDVEEKYAICSSNTVMHPPHLRFQLAIQLTTLSPLADTYTYLRSFPIRRTPCPAISSHHYLPIGNP